MVNNPVHVAVGVLINAQNEVCIACRPQGKHLAGLWEFPGGKVDLGETVEQALVREFREELGLDVLTENGGCEKLMDIHFEYPGKTVWLDVHIVRRFSGEAQGLEGQEVRWVSLDTIAEYDFPEANEPILQRLFKTHLSSET